MNNKKVLEIKNLSLSYKKKKILDNISFDIYEGEIILLSGANGCGKSSIISSIIRNFAYSPNISGEIIYEGIDLLKEKDIQNFRRSIGYTKQYDNFSESTCLKEIMSSIEIANNNMTKSEVISMFKEYKLENYINENPNNLSGGQKKIISVMHTLVRARSSRLFLIDEPLNNLDFNNSCLISNMINKIHKQYPKLSMLIVTHCHIFNIIDREIKISNGCIESTNTDYKCYNCFGDTDENGLYKIN